MADLLDPLPACPVCGAAGSRVIEDVTGDTVVLGCPACDTTWARPTDWTDR